MPPAEEAFAAALAKLLHGSTWTPPASGGDPRRCFRGSRRWPQCLLSAVALVAICLIAGTYAVHSSASLRPSSWIVWPQTSAGVRPQIARRHAPGLAVPRSVLPRRRWTAPRALGNASPGTADTPPALVQRLRRPLRPGLLPVLLGMPLLAALLWRATERHACRGGSRMLPGAPGAQCAACAVQEASVAGPLAPQNDLLLRAARGEAVERTPMWLFRQAGPYLPEYRQFKVDRGMNFFDICRDPEACAEVALQPLRRYKLDAGILFSDILVVAQALGQDVQLTGDGRILVPEPLTLETVEALPPPEAIDPTFVNDRLGHVLEAVRATRRKMAAEGKHVPLLGFAGAPWSLLHYMLGGTLSSNREVGSQWLAQSPAATQRALDVLTQVVIVYLSRQVECGAHALQLFDSTCGCITEAEFRAAALPALERIAAALRRLHPQVPLMVFARGAPYALPALQAAGYDVVTLDPACDRRGARAALATTAAESGGAPVTVQGNFDPQLLWTGVGSAEAVREEVAQMLTDLGPQRLIANLGSGLMGKEDPELVAVLVDTVRALSAQDVRGGASSDGRAG